MYNLFGDIYSVVVNINDNGEFEIVFINEGDMVEDMMCYVYIDVDKICINYC